jgi:hypothetical protein
MSSNSSTFDSALALIPLADAAHAALTLKRERVLTGFGAVKTQERDTRSGVNFGSASAGKAALWAGVSKRDAGVFSAAWSLAVALRAE